MTYFGVSQEEVQGFVSSNVGLYGVDLSRFSKYLLVQLTSANKYRTMSTFAVTDAIQDLEGIRRSRSTEKPRPFKGSALSGLWKVHFVDARFLPQNIYNEWGMFGKNARAFNEFCTKVITAEGKEPSSHGGQGRLVHEFVIGGYARRAEKRKLTGEWLIFGVLERKNVYLALCEHSDSPERDRSIYGALMRLCSPEFPTLFARDTQQGLKAPRPASGGRAGKPERLASGRTVWHDARICGTHVRANRRD